MIRTIALVPAGGTRLPPWFADALRRHVGRRGLVVDRDAAERLTGGSGAEALNALERDHDLVVYVTDGDPRPGPVRRCASPTR